MVRESIPFARIHTHFLKSDNVRPQEAFFIETPATRCPLSVQAKIPSIRLALRGLIRLRQAGNFGPRILGFADPASPPSQKPHPKRMANKWEGGKESTTEPFTSGIGKSGNVEIRIDLFFTPTGLFQKFSAVFGAVLLHIFPPPAFSNLNVGILLDSLSGLETRKLMDLVLLFSQLTKALFTVIGIPPVGGIFPFFFGDRDSNNIMRAKTFFALGGMGNNQSLGRTTFGFTSLAFHIKTKRGFTRVFFTVFADRPKSILIREIREASIAQRTRPTSLLARNEIRRFNHRRVKFVIDQIQIK